MNKLIYGENEVNPAIATSLNNIASTFYTWANKVQNVSIKTQFLITAIKYQTQSLHNFESIFNFSNHPTLYTIYQNVGQMYVEVVDFRNGLKCLLKGIIMKLQLDGILK